MSERHDHYATIRPTRRRYRVILADRTIVESSDAIELREHHAGKHYPPIIYFPAATLAGLETSDSTKSTYCPIKGEASYLDYGDISDAIWYYRDPLPGVAAIGDHYAFDSGKGFRVVAA